MCYVWAPASFVSAHPQIPEGTEAVEDSELSDIQEVSEEEKMAAAVAEVSRAQQQQVRVTRIRKILVHRTYMYVDVLRGISLATFFFCTNHYNIHYSGMQVHVASSHPTPGPHPQL